MIISWYEFLSENPNEIQRYISRDRNLSSSFIPEQGVNFISGN